METRNISNLEELRAEIRRLKELSREQEQVIRNDIAEIRERLKPKNLLIDLLESLTGIKLGGKEFFTGGLLAAVMIILKRMVSRAESRAAHTIFELAEPLLEKLRRYLRRFFGMKTGQEKAG